MIANQDFLHFGKKYPIGDHLFFNNKKHSLQQIHSKNALAEIS